MTKSAKTSHPKTTYYNAFPASPRPTSSICAVLWAIANDYRAISRSERRNVVYPGKAAGLIVDAPRNERGVKINKAGETSSSEFVLTEVGTSYYEKHIKPILPEGYKSEAPAPKQRRVGKELSLVDIKQKSA